MQKKQFQIYREAERNFWMKSTTPKKDYRLNKIKLKSKYRRKTN